MKKTLLSVFFVLAIVLAAGGVTAQTGPVLRTSISSYSPLPAEPGKIMEVWISVQNTGNAAAENVHLEFIDSFPFTLESEKDRKVTIPVIGENKDYLQKYRVIVSPNAIDGSNNLILKYSSENHPSVIKEDKIAIDVNSAEVQLVVDSARTNPATVSPGSKATLTMVLKNKARGSIVRDVSINLQLTPVYSATGLLVDLPFVPVGGSTLRTIDRLTAGESYEVTYELSAYPDAEARIYKVPVTISYYDDAGNMYNDTSIIGLEVNSQPELLVAIDATELNSGKLTGEVTFSVTNRGINDVKLLTMVLGESNAYELLSTSNEVYVGNIDSDDFETARFNVQVLEQGDIEFPVKIKYKDALNNNYEQDYTLKLNVRAPEQNGGGSTWIVVVVIVIIAVVAFVIYKRSRRKGQK